MTESDIDYARRRTAEELDQADRCDQSNVAQVHRRLAILYANMVAELRQLTPIELAERSDMPQPPRRELPSVRTVLAAAARPARLPVVPQLAPWAGRSAATLSIIK